MKSRRTKRRLAFLACCGALSALLVGCTKGSQSAVEVDDAPDPSARLNQVPRQRENTAAEQTGLAIRDDQLQNDLTRAEQAKLIVEYSLDEVQMAVTGNEPMLEHDLGGTVTQNLRELFTELGIRVQNTWDVHLSDIDAAGIADYAAEADADLVTWIRAETNQRAKLGQMISCEAVIKANVYEASGGLVATKELRTVGQRSSRIERAARSALEKGVEQIGPYLVEQIIRKVGQNVVARRLSLSDIEEQADLDAIVSHLRKQTGVNDVRTLKWDGGTKSAQLLVYLQPAAIDALPGFLRSTPGLDLEIKKLDRTGIRADQN
jgi:hypothetical protein